MVKDLEGLRLLGHRSGEGLRLLGHRSGEGFRRIEVIRTSQW